MKRILFILCFCVLGLSSLMAQELVTGTVVDKDDDPVPGARVEIVGRSEYALTDIDGTFRIELPVPATKVQVSYPGYPTIERKIKPDMVIKLGKGWGANAKGYRGFFDFYGGFGFGGKVNVVAGLNEINDIKNYLAFGFSMTHGYQINRHLFVGLGVGMYANALSAIIRDPEYDYNNEQQEYVGQTKSREIAMSNITFPFFADVRWDFGLAEKTAPYVGVKLGYQKSINPDDYSEGESYEWGIFESYSWNNGSSAELNVFSHDCSGFFFQPSIGMRTTMKGKRGFNIGLSYNVLFRKKLTASYRFSNYNGNSVPIVERKDLGISSGGVLMLNFGFDF